MSRNFVSCAVLALAGMLALPDASFARPGGAGGGFRGGGGVRGPVMIPRQMRGGMVRAPQAMPPQRPAHIRPLPPRFAPGLARTTIRAPFARLERRYHRGYGYGYGSAYIYPSTYDGYTGYGYVGVPYDPAAAIPVYSPPMVTNVADPLPPPVLPPRLSSTREENGEACRSERVTVPADGGEREITVVRC